MKKVAIYGIGNFGYAFLKHLDNKRLTDVELYAYDRNSELIKNLQATQAHLYFHKNIRLSKRVNFVHSPELLLKECDILVLAISSDATREVLTNIRRFLRPSVILLNTAKALDYSTGERLSTVKSGIIGTVNPYALAAGGTIAKDLFKHEPLGIDVACENESVLKVLTNLIKSDNLAVYPTNDLLGVEYASSFKNVISIFAGIVKGLGFSYGAETHMISHLAQVIGSSFIKDYGAKPETFSIGSQSWGNDLWMSCTGNTRNREFGILLGSGKKVPDAVAEMATAHKTVEGINTVRVLSKLPSLKVIPELSLLYRLIVTQEISIEKLRQHLLTNTVN